MIFDQWDVVLAPFPFIDIPVVKNRPILVLSSSGYNTAHGMIIAAMVTTAAKGPWPDDVPISDLATAGLRHACVIRWKLNTLPIASEMRRIGRLSSQDRASVRRSRVSVMW